MSKFQVSLKTTIEFNKLLKKSHQFDVTAALKLLEDDVNQQNSVGKRRWHHLKRGSNYTEVYRGLLQIATKPPVEDDTMVIYIDEATGRVCVREEKEFEDGRFVLIPSKE